ncbi:MAG: integrase arm-type DNA-binding domain-containing protein [Pseudomonadota bacterium]
MLTDLKIKSLRPKAKPYKVADGGGLYILVGPKGSKLWRLKYRFMEKEKLLSFGSYPELSLSKARKARDLAREQLADGLDPSQVRKEEKERLLQEKTRTFRTLTAEYLEKLKREGRAESTLKKARWVLDMACDDFGDMSAADVKAPDILKCLKKLEAKGTLETGRRLKMMIGSVLRYGISVGWLEADPTPALRGAITRPQHKPHAAITDTDALRGLMRAIADFGGQPTTRIGLQLLALLVPRPGELRRAKWQEFDTDKRVWTIPAERTKMRRPHRTPLSEAAISLLEELHPITGYCDFLLPSIRTNQKPISDATFVAALRRMGYSGEEMSAHGFRATFSTLANESGLWNPDAIERALAHVDGNKVRAAYARSEFWDERVRLADWWSNQISISYA